MSVGKRRTFSVKRLCPLGKGATIQTKISFGELPRTPPADLEAGPQPGALLRGPRQGAAPHPARGSAPWNPVSIIRILLHVWLYERALCTTLTRFKLKT